MNRRRAILLAAGALGGLGTLRVAAGAEGAQIGKPAPPFEVPDSANRKRRLSEFAGKSVVLEWTSPSCPFVRAQYQSGVMQDLQAWATKQGIVWLSVLSAHPSRYDYLPPAKAGEMHAERRAASTALLIDSEGAMGRAYGAVVTPHMFVVAPDGTLAYAGAISDTPTRNPEVARGSRNYVRAALEDLFAGRKVATPGTRPFGCTIAYGG